MTLSGYFMTKSVFGPALLESERLNVRNSTFDSAYMAICCPSSAGSWLQNEWPWMPL